MDRDEWYAASLGAVLVAVSTVLLIPDADIVWATRLMFSAVIGLLFVVVTALYFLRLRHPSVSQTPKITTGESYWGFHWRRPPVPKENRLNFWITMPLMFTMGIGVMTFVLFGGVNPSSGYFGIVTLGGIGLFLSSISLWFMVAEWLNRKETHNTRVQSIVQRKNALLSNLSASYDAFSRARTPEAQRASLSRIGTSFHHLCFGEASVEVGVKEPLTWDTQIRDNLSRYFETVAEGLTDPEAVGICSMHLTYIFQKGDAQTIDKMRATLLAPFDSIYAGYDFHAPSSQMFISALVGLHQYDVGFVNNVIDDSLVGDESRFLALNRSLDYDLFGILKGRPDYPKIGAHIVRKIDEFVGKDKEAVRRAELLSGRFY